MSDATVIIAISWLLLQKYIL